MLHQSIICTVIDQQPVPLTQEALYTAQHQQETFLFSVHMAGEPVLMITVEWSLILTALKADITSNPQAHL